MTFVLTANILCWRRSCPLDLSQSWDRHSTRPAQSVRESPDEVEEELEQEQEQEQEKGKGKEKDKREEKAEKEGKKRGRRWNEGKGVESE